jgi:hypothetical protein
MNNSHKNICLINNLVISLLHEKIEQILGEGLLVNELNLIYQYLKILVS